MLHMLIHLNHHPLRFITLIILFSCSLTSRLFLIAQFTNHKLFIDIKALPDCSIYQPQTVHWYQGSSWLLNLPTTNCSLISRLFLIAQFTNHKLFIDIKALPDCSIYQPQTVHWYQGSSWLLNLPTTNCSLTSRLFLIAQFTNHKLFIDIKALPDCSIYQPQTVHWHQGSSWLLNLPTTNCSLTSRLFLISQFTNHKLFIDIKALPDFSIYQPQTVHWHQGSSWFLNLPTANCTAELRCRCVGY